MRRQGGSPTQHSNTVMHALGSGRSRLPVNQQKKPPHQPMFGRDERRHSPTHLIPGQQNTGEQLAVSLDNTGNTSNRPPKLANSQPALPARHEPTGAETIRNHTIHFGRDKHRPHTIPNGISGKIHGRPDRVRGNPGHGREKRQRRIGRQDREQSSVLHTRKLPATPAAAAAPPATAAR
jgi:hypothetical protein